MKDTNPETELIEIIEAGFAEHPGKAKFKGKLLHPEVLSLCDYECLEVAMPADFLFDFTAKELPEDMHFAALLTQDECLGLLQSVTLLKEERYVEMEFRFEIYNVMPPKAGLNPYITLPLLLASLKREKYKIKTWVNSPGIYCIIFKVPFTDNVYSHYIKHLTAFEKICLPIETGIIKSLNKKLKQRLGKIAKG